VSTSVVVLVAARDLRPRHHEVQPTEGGSWYVVEAVTQPLDEHGAIDPAAGLVVHADGREWPTLPTTLWTTRRYDAHARYVADGHCEFVSRSGAWCHGRAAHPDTEHWSFYEHPDGRQELVVLDA
jgi:hypothetical protein